MELEIVKGSVVYAKVDAITNAANEMLMAGGGVCGAIFSEAGHKELQNECNQIGFCNTGEAVITKGYNLNAKYIIHAVGPRDGNKEKLKNAFLNTLLLADNKKLETLALVPISSGIFGFPLDSCAIIAIKTILSFKPKNLKKCYVYCYSEKEYQVFLDTYNQIVGERK